MSGDQVSEAEMVRLATDDRAVVNYLVDAIVSSAPGLPFHWRRWAMREKCPPQYTVEELRDLLSTALAMLAEAKEKT